MSSLRRYQKVLSIQEYRIQVYHHSAWLGLSGSLSILLLGHVLFLLLATMVLLLLATTLLLLVSLGWGLDVVATLPLRVERLLLGHWLRGQTGTHLVCWVETVLDVVVVGVERLQLGLLWHQVLVGVETS